MQLLNKRQKELPDVIKDDAKKILEKEEKIIEKFRSILKKKIGAKRIRSHGDYHLGQVLYTGKDFVIIDFEGEPARPLGERLFKRSPLRDIAGMLRSFHYAIYTVLYGQGPVVVRKEDLLLLEKWARFWHIWVSSTFLKGYLDSISPRSLLPSNEEQLKGLLDVNLLEKALYELGYELNNRPNWVSAPIRGILDLME
jgi:maltose alpha-D-glucosyltransferase/alpha-amylase